MFGSSVVGFEGGANGLRRWRWAGAAVVLVAALSGCSATQTGSGAASSNEASPQASAPEASPTPEASLTENPDLPDEVDDSTAYALPNSYTELSDREWKKIVRNPDAYAGKGYILYANVFQFDAATGTDAFLARASNKDERSYGYWDGNDTAAFFAPSESVLSNVVEGDVVRIKAVVDSAYSYDTQAGGNTTVPKFYVHKIKVIGSTDD